MSFKLRQLKVPLPVCLKERQRGVAASRPEIPILHSLKAPGLQDSIQRNHVLGPRYVTVSGYLTVRAATLHIFGRRHKLDHSCALEHVV